MTALLKTSAEIEIMREGGGRLGAILDTLKREAKVGVTTNFLDSLARKLIREAGAEPAFLKYRPSGSKRAYPKTLCASVNEVVVHGIPSDAPLKEGDVVSLDLGLKYKKFYVDAALTVGVGNISDTAQKLIAATREALERAIAEVRPGRTLGDIGAIVEKTVGKHGFSVVRSLTGHGIGRELHEEPTVLNFGNPGGGEVLREGIVIAIEPMVAAGRGETVQREDDSYATKDNSLAAHFEHTVAVTKHGSSMLTATLI
ncbi:type I methionyl aminopeptidase [Candidatus Parcubacteria bacterium]|nr:MAG: type I methionyl aminopeptidase [Candidatus Parcubacteria bacterium]